MKRLIVLLVAVGALVAVAAAWVPSPAATVDGTAISRQSLNADLSAVAASPAFQCYLQAQIQLGGQSAAGLFPVTGAGPGTGATPPTYNSAFVSYWLTSMEEDLIVAHAVAARHLQVTDADLAIGRATLLAQVSNVLGEVQSQTGSTCAASGSTLLSSVPVAFVTEQVRSDTERDILASHVAGYSLSAGSVARYYAAHRSSFDTECISFAGFATKADATAALASIKAGTPIGKSGTLTQLGCGLKAAITTLPPSVVDQAVGKVSEPVTEGTGTKYALLVVTSRKPTALAKIRTTAREVMLASGASRTQALLEASLRTAQISVDPRYGQVTSHSAVIVPPPSPEGSFVLNPTAALPPALRSLAASSGATQLPATSAPASG